MSTILIIDDDIEIQLLLGHMFRSIGYEIKIALDGQHALRSLEQIQVDLILTDLKMAPMNGRDFLIEKNANPRLKKIPTLLVSSENDTQDLLPYVVGILKKPIHLGKLSNLVSETLRVSKNPA